MSKIKIDQATKIRKGEELDIAALEPFLLENIPGAKGPLVIDQFPGGASNLTYLIRLGERKLVLRRPPFGSKVKSAHDMSREYKVLSNLSKHYDKAPKPLIFTNDDSVIGAQFYVMEKVEGVILRTKDGPAKELDKKTVFNIAESLIDTMVELHSLDYEAVGLGDLGKPDGYGRRQVDGWTRRYHKSNTHDIPEMIELAEWLDKNLPAKADASLIHNDFKHDNVILDINDLTKVRAILDWEMSTLGDPLMDLATTLSYWFGTDDPPIFQMASKYPSALEGNPNRMELIEMYSNKSGRSVQNIVFYYAFGLFKTAVVIQQIYYRFHHGLTKDPRFASMNVMVEGMAKFAIKAIEKDRIIDL